MIYKDNYFGKELRQACIEKKISTRRKITFAFFLGLLSFAAHFILQTLTETVLMDTFPHLMQASYFSTVSTYNAVSFFLYVLYFIIYYDYLSFAELRKNKWYLLVKMGYRPSIMIFSKLLASLCSVLLIYATGFAVTVVMTVFLKYSFIYAYLPSLFLTGLFDMVTITVAALAVSLLVKSPSSARYIIFFVSILLVLSRHLFGYRELVTNRILMQNIFYSFNIKHSAYSVFAGTLILACFLICVLKAKSVAKYYSVSFDLHGYVLEDDLNIFIVNEKSGRLKNLTDKDTALLRAKVFDIVVTSLLVVFVFAAMAVNVFIIMLSTSQPGKEVTIRGVIPYIFKSNTMEPTIMENDLAFFDRINGQEPVSVGDIVLFTENAVVYVERVIEVEGDKYTVDIDYYPPMTEEAAMVRTVERSAIYGLFTYADRWLGVLILFSNTLFGRILFLLGPVVLLFFYKPIKSFIATFKVSEGDD